MLDSLIKNMLRLVGGIFLQPGLNSHCGFLYYKIVFLFLRIFLHLVSLLLFSPLVKTQQIHQHFQLSHSPKLFSISLSMNKVLDNSFRELKTQSLFHSLRVISDNHSAAAVIFG